MPTEEQIAELQDSIANLEAILDAGATTVTEDGQTTSFDLDAIERRLRAKQTRLARLQGSNMRRPTSGYLNMGGC